MAIGSIHDEADRAGLARRIRSVRPDSKAKWGKMNAAQMLEHCARFDHWIQEGGPNRQTFMGRLFGRIALKRVLRPDKPMDRNIPTMPSLVAPLDTDFARAQQAWLSSLEAYAGHDADRFVHDFFGPINRQELGAFVWRHADHHLKQFGA